MFFKSNRDARKMNFKGFQYTKDRQTGTEPAIKIYWHSENRNYKGRIVDEISTFFDAISTDCRSGRIVVFDDMSHRRFVVFDEMSRRRNDFRLNNCAPDFLITIF